MRALRLGSYSMWATLAGMPSLSRRKSMIRYCCLWPPPWCRVVILPCTLRPAFFGLGTTRDRSGRGRVISEKSEKDIPRRPGVVGLAFRTPMARSLPCLEQLDLVAGCELDDRPLGGGALADDVAGPLGLAPPVQGVDRHDLYPPDRLDRVPHVHLGRGPRHQEGVGVVVDQAVGLLAHHRPEDDVAGRDRHSAPSPASPVSPVSAGGWETSSATAAEAAGSGASAGASMAASEPVICASASRVITTTSAASTR